MAKASTSIGTPLHAFSPQTRSTDGMARTHRFEQTIMPHLDAAYNLARWLTRNDSDAQDVVQGAYLRAFKYFDSFQGENPSAWLLAIVRNACFTWMRRNRPSEEVVGSEPVDEEEVGNAAPLLGGGSQPRPHEGERAGGKPARRVPRGDRVAGDRGHVLSRDCRHRRHSHRYRDVAAVARASCYTTPVPNGEAELNPDAGERHERASGTWPPHPPSPRAANPGTL